MNSYQWLLTHIAADEVNEVINILLKQVTKALRKGSISSLNLYEKIDLIVNEVMSHQLSKQGFLGLFKRELKNIDNQTNGIYIEDAISNPTYIVVDENGDYCTYSQSSEFNLSNGFVLLTKDQFNSLKKHSSMMLQETPQYTITSNIFREMTGEMVDEESDGDVEQDPAVDAIADALNSFKTSIKRFAENMPILDKNDQSLNSRTKSTCCCECNCNQVQKTGEQSLYGSEGQNNQGFFSKHNGDNGMPSNVLNQNPRYEYQPNNFNSGYN